MHVASEGRAKAVEGIAMTARPIILTWLCFALVAGAARAGVGDAQVRTDHP